MSDAVYRALLRSFPAAQRSRYGGEMLDAFRAECRQQRNERGVLHAVRYAAAAYADVLRAGVQERRRQRTDRDAGVLSGMTQDLRHAARSLTRSWTFTLVCVLSVAIGVGINAALALLMYGTLAPPPAVTADDAVELVVLTQGRALDDIWSYPDFVDVQRAETGLDVTGWTVGTRQLRTADGGDSAELSAMYVSANYFHTLGIDVARGRAFFAEDDEVTGEPAAVIGHALWQQRLGGAADVIGSVLDLNGTQFRVVGVAPAGYVGHRAGYGVDLWLPLWTHPLLGVRSAYRTDRSADMLQVIGRLHAGTTLAEASAAVAGVMRGLAEAHPATNAERSAAVAAYSKQGAGSGGAIATLVFMSLSGMVLLVVCFNLGGMVLVRSAARARELALRQALGSSRWRLVRYMMAESLILALTGGLLSLSLCIGGLHYFARRTGQDVPADLTSLLVALCIGLALVGTVVIGLAPALRFSRPGLLGAVTAAATGDSRRRGRVHRFATSLQTALAIPLLVVNGMALQATRLMDEADYGFEPRNLYVAMFDLSADGYSAEDAGPFLQRARAAVAAVPGVQSVSAADGIPLDYARRTRRVSPAGEERYTWVHATRADEAYLRTIATPLARGRAFDRGDVAGAEPVVMMTESLAAQLFPGRDALGQRVQFALERGGSEPMTVVGIVRDVAGRSHDTDPANIYVPFWQQPTSRVALVVRTAAEDAAVARAIQDAVLSADPGLSRPTVVTSRQLMQAPKADIRAMSLFIGGLATLTLLLAALGVYGVVAFAVASRTREIGVRMAVGASRRRVLLGVLGDGARLALPGVALGAILAAAIANLFFGRWYAWLQRTTLDPVMLTLGAATAVIIVLLASSMPARRAASVQPMMALRAD